MNITIGQYYPVNSVIHRLDARLKLIATMVFIVALFVAKGFPGYILGCVLLGVIIAISHVPFKLMIKGLKGIIMIVLFTVVLNVFFTRGGTTLVEFGIIKITSNGVILATRMAFRLVLLVMGSSVLTLTTSPIQLTVGLEYILAPFKKIGVPSHEIAMMMTIALRFIPTLMEELDKIRKAQMARGADFDTGGLVKKAKSLIPLLVPLFISSFRRADDLAMAMEARCYRGDVDRTRMKEPKLGLNDYIASGVMVLFVAIIVAMRVVWKV